MKFINFKLTLILFGLVKIYSANTCELNLWLTGEWVNYDFILSVNIPQKKYENFDEFIKTIVEEEKKDEEKKYLNNLKKRIIDDKPFGKQKLEKTENLNDFIDGNITLEQFLQNKAFVDIHKDNTKDFSLDLTGISKCDIYFMNAMKYCLLKDLYKIKDEHKDKVKLLKKYIKENKLAKLTLLWLNKHDLSTYFTKQSNSDIITVKNEFIDNTKRRPKDYKDIIINNGVIVEENDTKKTNTKPFCNCCITIESRI